MTDTSTRVRPYRAWLTLVLLFLVATVNFIDRQILVILLEPIKRDLRLSDTELGVLTGVAFALCFAIAGIPIARLAEVRSRRTIIGLSLAAWSIITAACGLAQNFLQLLSLRFAVALGESGSAPASQSLIANLFPHGRRATAIAIFSCGVPVGVLIGLAAGGALNEAIGWRYAFAIVGLPGLVLAGAVFLFASEPRRLHDARMAQPQSGMFAALRQVWAIPSYRRLALGAALHLFATASLNQWIGSYLIRTYELGTRELGLSLGLIVGIAGGLGTLGGGYLGDRLGKRDPRWFGWLPALIAAAAAPLTLGVYFAPSYPVAMIFLVGAVIAATAYMGPVFGAIQSVAPPHMRATAAALTMFLGGVLGQALGPTGVGILSDMFRQSGATDSLRWALAAIAPVSLIAVWLFLRAAKSLKQDMAASTGAAA